MRIRNILIGSMIAFTLLPTQPTSAAGVPGGYSKCIGAILSTNDSANKAKTKINGHDFWCKPATKRNKNGVKLVTVSGQLSHILRLRKDDQLYYSFTYDRCSGKRVGSVDFRTDRGGIAPVVGEIGRLVGKDGWEEAHRKRGRDWDGDWKSTAVELVYYISDKYNQLTRVNPKIMPECSPQSSARKVLNRSKVRDHRTN